MRPYLVSSARDKLDLRERISVLLRDHTVLRYDFLCALKGLVRDAHGIVGAVFAQISDKPRALFFRHSAQRAKVELVNAGAAGEVSGAEFEQKDNNVVVSFVSGGKCTVTVG